MTTDPIAALEHQWRISRLTYGMQWAAIVGSAACLVGIFATGDEDGTIFKVSWVFFALMLAAYLIGRRTRQHMRRLIPLIPDTARVAALEFELSPPDEDDRFVGLVAPITFEDDGTIIDGHHRAAAMDELRRSES